MRELRLTALQRFAARQQRHSAAAASRHAGSASAPPKVTNLAARGAAGAGGPSRAVTRLDFGGAHGAAAVSIDSCGGEVQHDAQQHRASEVEGIETEARLASRDGHWRALNRRPGHDGLPQTPVRAAAAARAHGIQPEYVTHVAQSMSTASTTPRKARAATSRPGALRDTLLHVKQ